MTPSEKTYIYPIRGGELHRYDTPQFKTGIYKDGFLMDRNLGASLTFDGDVDKGCLYQFGRKDPFIEGLYTEVHSDKTGQFGKNTRYGIHHPDYFIRGGTYTSSDDDLVSFDQIKWYDPKISGHSILSDYCEADKSIYDPCPPGWQVPDSDSYIPYYRAPDMFHTGGGVGGYYFCPEGNDRAEITGAIYFPYYILWGYQCQTEPGGYSYGYGYVSSLLTSNSPYGSTSIYSVRCVKPSQDPIR